MSRSISPEGFLDLDESSGMKAYAAAKSSRGFLRVSCIFVDTKREPKATSCKKLRERETCREADLHCVQSFCGESRDENGGKGSVQWLLYVWGWKRHENDGAWEFKVLRTSQSLSRLLLSKHTLLLRVLSHLER